MRQMTSSFYYLSHKYIRHWLKYQKRYFSIKEKKSSKKTYSQTILLPKTKFPQWFSPHKRIFLDDFIIKSSGFSELYSWQRKNIVGQEFVLHDGPPYANGPVHMGHALNKILKDIIIRFKLLEGFKIHYKPGWDCHGLPIELKAMADAISQKCTPLEIRKRARIFAQNAIADQKCAFKSWGIMADWEKQCYHTFDNDYVINQFQQFYRLFETGVVYRDIKPVYWSPVTRSALAEAELEYRNDHRSKSWIVRLQMTHIPWSIQHYVNLPLNIKIYNLIWTTTPWTLPANCAIAYNNNIKYAFVQFNNLDGIYIVAEKLVNCLEKKLNRIGNVLFTISGEKLKGCKYNHPLNNEEHSLIHGNHVTADTGTGLVHTASAHGHEDFLLALSNNIPFKCIVNERGEFTTDVGDTRLHNLPILSEKTQKIISTVIGNENIMAEEEIIHSYPYDWRTGTPVIIRSSKQWFIKTEAIKVKALETLNNVNVIPARNKQALINQIESRPYWCISRQRSWGVPIPVLYSTVGNDEENIINRDLIDNYCQLLRKHGTDFWWSLKLNEILPKDVENKLNIRLNDLKKSEDILDIWLDSGLSWSSVLEGKQADLYLEGVDQSTGWFQSSLLTSVALKGSAPYKNVYIHGFTLDSQGRKMSKSLGNVIDPQEIIRGSNSKKGSDALGIDVIRWWIGAHGSQHCNLPVTDTSLNNSKEEIKKLRNVFKFLLGSINDLPAVYINEKSSVETLSTTDLYLLHSLSAFLKMVYEFYESFQFNKICQSIINFITNEVSSFYFVITKDKLYCNEENDILRRNIQFTMYHIINTLALAAAPITPVLIEEVFMHHPHNLDKIPFFQQTIQKVPVDNLFRTKEDIDNIMFKVFEIKEEFSKECPVNIHSSQIWCHLYVNSLLYETLKHLKNIESSNWSELADVLQVSGITLHLDDDVQDFKMKLSSTDLFKCPRCWKFTSKIEDNLCDRCNDVILKHKLF